MLTADATLAESAKPAEAFNVRAFADPPAVNSVVFAATTYVTSFPLGVYVTPI